LRDLKQQNTDDDIVKELAVYRSAREREEPCRVGMDRVSVSIQHSDCAAEDGVTRRSAKRLNSKAVAQWGEERTVCLLVANNSKTQINRILADLKGADNRPSWNMRPKRQH